MTKLEKDQLDKITGGALGNTQPPNEDLDGGDQSGGGGGGGKTIAPNPGAGSGKS